MFLGCKFDSNDKCVSTKSSRKEAHFKMAILVDKTSEYTVEFWFKANKDVEIKDINEEN